MRLDFMERVINDLMETERVVTLSGTELPCRIMFDQMSEGAVTLTRDGVIAYCNQRFADIMRAPLGRVIGAPLRRFVLPASQPTLAALCSQAKTGTARGELILRAGAGRKGVAVSVSFAPLRLEGRRTVIGLIGVVADISELKRADELRTRLTGQIMAAQDDDRKRVASDLHDGTGQSLAGLLVGLRTIARARTVEEAAERAGQLGDVAAQALDDLARVTRGLHPGALDDLGLPAAVSGQVEEFALLHGIAVDLRVKLPDSDLLPPLVQTAVFRILQEALTSVARHAGARSVRIRLGHEDGLLRLSVWDDGVGFKPPATLRAALQNHRVLGLQTMRERAELLGGSLDLESGPAKGTTIDVRIPCPRGGSAVG